MASYISLLDLTYPVGAYYLSSVSTSPASFFGGAWSVLTGKFLYCNSGTGTGGSNTHTLTSSQMPSHSHSLYLYTIGSGAYANLKEPTGRSQAVTTSLSSTSRASFSNTITSTGGGLLTTICQHIRRAIVGEEPLNLCGGEA